MTNDAGETLEEDNREKIIRGLAGARAYLSGATFMLDQLIASGYPNLERGLVVGVGKTDREAQPDVEHTLNLVSKGEANLREAWEALLSIPEEDRT